MAESVYEERFHDSLEIMEAPINSGIRLYGVYFSLSREANILVYWEEVENGVYEKWAEILKKEERGVLDLRAQILEEYLDLRACHIIT